MPRILAALSLLLVTVTAVRVSAQVYPYRDGTPRVTGYRSEVLAEVMIQESEFIRLAEAVLADKYRWRPAPDVRSSAEVFLHASAANFNLYMLVGTPTPVELTRKPSSSPPPTKQKLSPRSRRPTPTPKRPSAPCPMPTFKKLSHGMAGRLPNAASCSTSFNTSPSISVSRSLTRARLVWSRSGH